MRVILHSMWSKVCLLVVLLLALTLTLSHTADARRSSGSSIIKYADVMELNDDNFFEVAKPGNSVFVKFYTPWCRYCKLIAPTWGKYAADVKKKSSVVIADVNCEDPKSSHVCRHFRIGSFPTIALFDPVSSINHGHKYRDERLPSHFTKFLKQYKAFPPPLEETFVNATAVNATAAALEVKEE